MRKRPLCLAAVLLLLVLWILPKDLWYEVPEIPSGEQLTITGTVTKREQTEEKQAYYLKNCFTDREHSEFSVLAYTQKGDSYPIGSEISLYGTIYQLKEGENPGQFDARSYYQSQGILYTFQTEAVLSCQGESKLLEGIASLREYLGERLLEIYEERDAGILKAVLLGDKSSLREEDELLYQKNGISHLLAISGLHISMIGISLYRFLRKCCLNFLEAGIPSGILLLLYGCMTGFGVSTVRAVCMFLVLIFGDILGRTYDMASAMALAALILLLRNPLQAYQAGFLLSFGAVAGICVVSPVLQSVLGTERKWQQTVLVSASLMLVTYPVSVHFFYEYSLYSMLLNFIVIPCMPLVMGFGGAGMFLGCFFQKAGGLLGLPAHWTLSFYEFLGEWIVTWPNAVLCLGREAKWQLILYYVLLCLLLFLLWYGRRRIYLLFLPAAVIMVSLRFYPPLQITALSVGQGDCLYVRLPDQTTCLVDGGSTSEKKVGQYRILPYLKYCGTGQLDYVFLTHLDNDHINGIRELVEQQGTLDGVKIHRLLFPAIQNPDEAYLELWDLAQEKGIEVGTVGEGDQLFGEDFRIECLYPFQNAYSEDKNNSSTVLRLSYGAFSMLFTGDMGFAGEQDLLERGSLQRTDVWKVSHHGSKYSGSEEFLETIDPQLSLISVGRNSYGHPSPELLERLSKVGSLVETTLEEGALTIKSDGSTFVLERWSEK